MPPAAAAEQGAHRRSFVNEDADVALGLSQRQSTLERGEGTGDVALRLVRQRLQRQDLDQAPRSLACLGRFPEALQ